MLLYSIAAQYLSTDFTVCKFQMGNYRCKLLPIVDILFTDLISTDVLQAGPQTSTFRGSDTPCVQGIVFFDNIYTMVLRYY